MSTAESAIPSRLDRPVDRSDHALGPARSDLTLVEYGSYACPYCRTANEEIAKIRDRFGNRLRYVFRQRPIAGDLARRAAEVAESAPDEDAFWKAHVELMTRSHSLTEDDLAAVVRDLDLTPDDPEVGSHARARVQADVRSADASGVRVTPTFFINGRRWDGPWDEHSLSEAMLGSLGHRVHSAAVRFASWAPATGVLLLLMSVLAVVLVNSPMGERFLAFWETPLGFSFGAGAFRMSALQWVDDGLLTIFFLLVALEIKRELTVGSLASPRAAALPIAAAIGGIVMPAALYSLFIHGGPWRHGWGVPTATDTAFAVALIVMLGRRVPVDLRVFLTAASIVDDIGAIVVVALFYSGALHGGYLAGAAAVTAALVLLNRGGVYRAAPYALLGVALWICVHGSGLHTTLAGVVLAFLIPTRPPPNLNALRAQANTVFTAEMAQAQGVLRHGPSEPALRALDAIHDRLESPADRLLRAITPWSSFLVLPVFALANAGVPLSSEVVAGRGTLIRAVAIGLVAGKPLGLLVASALAVRMRLAVKPSTFSWRQLVGAGWLAGIGFTMSLFIAGRAFSDPGDFTSAKIAVFAASIVAALIGVALLWKPARTGEAQAPPEGVPVGDRAPPGSRV